MCAPNDNTASFIIWLGNYIFITESAAKLSSLNVLSSQPSSKAYCVCVLRMM